MFDCKHALSTTEALQLVDGTIFSKYIFLKETFLIFFFNFLFFIIIIIIFFFK